MHRNTARMLCFAFLLQFVLFQIAEAKRKGKRKSQVPSDFFYVMGFVLLAMLAPMIIHFLYNVIKDPLTPHLLFELWMRIREAICGVPRQQKRKRTKSEDENDLYNPEAVTNGN